MTVYDGRVVGRWLRTRVRPTLRLRLTLLNGAIVVCGCAVLLVAAFLFARNAVARTVPTENTELRTGLMAALEHDLFLYGFVAALAICAISVAGAYVVAGRSLRPLQ